MLMREYCDGYIYFSINFDLMCVKFNIFIYRITTLYSIYLLYLYKFTLFYYNIILYNF
jgi:hypothetical protein